MDCLISWVGVNFLFLGGYTSLLLCLVAEKIGLRKLEIEYIKYPGCLYYENWVFLTFSLHSSMGFILFYFSFNWCKFDHYIILMYYLLCDI